MPTASPRRDARSSDLKLVDGAGAVRDESGLYVVEGGAARITVRFARDDRPKDWTATVTDLMTGKAATQKF